MSGVSYTRLAGWLPRPLRRHRAEHQLEARPEEGVAPDVVREARQAARDEPAGGAWHRGGGHVAAPRRAARRQHRRLTARSVRQASHCPPDVPR